MAECATRKKNIALSKCNKLPGLIKMMFTTPDDFFFTPEQTATAAAFKTAVQDLLVEVYADRGYLFPPFMTFTNNSEATVFEATPLGRRKVIDGQYRFNFGISENICVHKAMYTHQATSGVRVFLIDHKNQWIGTEDTDGNFLGLTIAMLDTEKFTFNDGSVVTKSPINVDLLDNTELDQDGSILSGDIGKIVNQVIRLADVTLTIVGTPSTTSIVVDVAAECDGTPISGLVTADFILLDNDDGAPHAKTAAESATVPGRYTLTGTAFEDSTLDLTTPALLSIKAYESTGAVAVNVP